MTTKSPIRASGATKAPALSVGRDEPERNPCANCGELVVVGFEEGHRQFAHHIRGVRRRPIGLSRGDHPKLPGWLSFLLFFPAAGATFSLVYLVASWITTNGHSLLGIHATTQTSRSILIVVVAGVLLVPASPIFMGLTILELGLVALVSLPVRAASRALHRDASPVRFNRLDAFTCTVHHRELAARYTLRPRRGRLEWNFRFDREPSDFIADFIAIDEFARVAGPAIEQALALPPALRTYVKPPAEESTPGRGSVPTGRRSAARTAADALPGPRAETLERGARAIVIGDDLVATGVTVVAFPARMLTDPDYIWTVFRSVLADPAHGRQNDWAAAWQRSAQDDTERDPLRPRRLDTASGVLHLGDDELVGLAFPGPECAEPDRVLAVLSRFAGDDVGFVRCPNGFPVGALQRHRSLAGVRLVATSAERSPFEVLATLPGLQWLSCAANQTPDESDLALLASMTTLTHLDIRETGTSQPIRSSTLQALDALSELRSLRLGFLWDADAWAPELRQLRVLALELTLSSGLNRGGSDRWKDFLPDLSRLATLDEFATGWGGSVDAPLHQLAALPALRHLRLGNMSVPVAGPAGINALSTMEQLRTLIFNNGGLLVPHGQIRELASMKALALLRATVDGATQADIDFLHTQLPGATLDLQPAKLLPRNYTA